MAELVVLTLPNRESVLEAIDTVRAAPGITIHHSAVLAKAEDGEVTVLEDDLTVNEGAIAGGTLGAVIGSVGIAGLGALLLPGVGALVALGAGALIGGLIGGATGGVTAALVDLGLDHAEIERLAARMTAGMVAILVEIDGAPEAIARLHTALAPFNVEVIAQRARP